MTRAIDRWFLRYRRTGDVRLLGKVFDRTAPELWRLAAHLCADRHDAEDAVQTAFLAAIENRDAWDEERPLVPWLLGVLANRVREQRRREGRVVDAARAGAPTSAPDPSVVAAQRELDARLASSLVALGEPYTTTLRRHLFEGLAAVDLARELGVPAGTVRMRLHRGLERLRELLPAGLGTAGIATVAAPLLLTDSARAAMREQVLAKAVAVGGAVPVAHTTAAGWLAAVLLVAALVPIVWSWGPGSAEPAKPVAGSAQAQGGTSPTANAVPPTDSAAAFAAAAHESGSAPRSDARSAAPGVVGTLRVLMVNQQTREPLRGLRVTVSRVVERVDPGKDRRGAESATSRSTEEAPAPRTQSDGLDDSLPWFAEGETDDEGRVDLVVVAGPVRVTTMIGNSSDAQVLAGVVTEHVHVQPVRFTASVKVVAADGAAVGGATILGSSLLVGVSAPIGITDQDGLWRASRVESSLQVRAVLDGLAASNAVWLAQHRGQATLSLGGPAPRLHGIVRDAAGASLPKASVVLWQQGSAFEPFQLRADDTGQFDCSWVAPGRYRWLAGDVDSELAPGLGQVDIAFGMPSLELKTTLGARIVVRAQRTDGSPIGGLGIRTIAQRDELLDAPGNLNRWRHRSTTVTSGDGSGELTGVIAGKVLVATKWGGNDYAETVDVADGAVATVTFVCSDGKRLVVEVVDEHDMPHVGVGVGLGDQARPGRVLTTDARGRVEFAMVAAGEQEVAIGSAGMKGLAWVRQKVGTGELHRIVVPRSLASARVRGRLIGEGLDGQVTLNLFRAGFGASVTERTSRTFDAKSGQFEFDRLPAGRFHFQVVSDARLQVLAMRTFEVSVGGDVDIGTIACGSGELVVRLRGDGPLRSPRAGVGFTSQLELGPTSDGVLQLSVPEGAWQVLAWAENAQPAIASAVVVNGARTELDVNLVPGTPTTFLPVLDRPVFEFTLADGRQFECMVPHSKSLTLGLPPGRHRLIHRGLNGEWAETTFDVGSEPGTVDLTKLPTTR